MCTVTLIPSGHGIRLACNRDELHTRPQALPPVVRQFGARHAILPIDPASSGTWIAVNDAGLAMTLLNVNAGGSPDDAVAPPRSRGTIVPALLECATVDEAVRRALELEAGAYPPFRLVIASVQQVAELRSDGRTLTLESHDVIDEPICFTSSGLGDHLVKVPRRERFEQIVLRAGDDFVGAQDRFHRDHQPEAPHLSVCMRRADARTVSFTVITIEPDRLSLAYHPDAPDQPAESAVVELLVSSRGAV